MEMGGDVKKASTKLDWEEEVWLPGDGENISQIIFCLMFGLFETLQDDYICLSRIEITLFPSSATA